LQVYLYLFQYRSGILSGAKRRKYLLLFPERAKKINEFALHLPRSGFIFAGDMSFKPDEILIVFFQIFVCK